MLLDKRDDIIPEPFAVHPSCLPFQVLKGLGFSVVDTIDNTVEHGVGHD